MSATTPATNPNSIGRKLARMLRDALPRRFSFVNELGEKMRESLLGGTLLVVLTAVLSLAAVWILHDDTPRALAMFYAQVCSTCTFNSVHSAMGMALVMVAGITTVLVHGINTGIGGHTSTNELEEMLETIGEDVLDIREQLRELARRHD